MDYFPPINGNPADPNRPYINADPGNNIQGSWPHAKAIEGSMREILEVINSAGLAPDGDDLTQLRQAIESMISNNVAANASTTVKGIVELTTGPEALGGVDSTRAVTSAALASAMSLNPTGELLLPGGFKAMWGRKLGPSSGSTDTITLPSSFLSNAYFGTFMLETTAGASSSYFGIPGLSTFPISIAPAAFSPGVYYRYFVIGR